MCNLNIGSRSFYLVTLAAFFTAGFGVASAQTTAAAASDEVQEIIVTGTRRATAAQDVAVSIDVVSWEEIEASGFATPSDLQYLVPSVNFNPVIGAGFLIRGLGSQGFDYNLEQAVSVVVDDVVQGMPRSIGLNTLADVERVEVLKGPQGTLFGKNATAGVVYVVTRKPELDTFSLFGNMRYGTDNETRIETTVNLPVSSTSAGRMTGVFKRRDGYLPNLFTGEDAGGYEDYALRAKFLWQPTEDLELYFLGEIQDHQNEGTNTLESITAWPDVPIDPNSTSRLDYGLLLGDQFGIEFTPDNRAVAENEPTPQTVHHEGLQATLNYQMGEYTLTSVTAYKNQDSTNQTDGDKTTTDFNKWNVNELDGRQITQELRLTSPIGGFIDYVIGGFYFDQDMDAHENQGGLRGRTDLPPYTYVGTMGGSQFFHSSSDSVAFFGEANLHFTDWATLILGGRYTDDEVAASFNNYDDPRYNFVGAFRDPISDSKTTDDTTIKAVLQIKPNDNLMFYGGYTEGYKAPAIGTASGSIEIVEPETVDSYEIGMKGLFFDNRLSLNLAVFQMDFDDLQTTTLVFRTGGLFEVLLTNADGVESKGVEVDATYYATPDLRLYGRYTYNPVEYKEFFIQCYRGQPVSPTPGPGLCYDTPGGTVYDISGFPSTLSPENSFNVGFDYSPQISNDMELIANAMYSYKSEQYSEAGEPNTILPSYGLLNARIGVGRLDGSMRIAVYGRNLLDEDFRIRHRPLSFSGPGSYRSTFSIESKRTVGITLDFTF